MKKIEISYAIYPGSSARWFPKIMSAIFVNEENYKKWKNDEQSVKFEEVLENPAEPVKFIDYNGTHVINNPFLPPVADEVMYWYHTVNPMEIAIDTARKGHQTKFFEKMKENKN